MPALQQNLELTRCPHCNVNRPLLSKIHQADTQNHSKQNQRIWVFYKCGNCGGVVMACAGQFGIEAQVFPAPICHGQGVQGQLFFHSLVHGPADDLARV